MLVSHRIQLFILVLRFEAVATTEAAVSAPVAEAATTTILHTFSKDHIVHKFEEILLQL